jgi:hypothetical protein
MRSTRAAALAGFSFVVVYVVAWLVSRSPDSDDPSAQIASYYTDKGNRVMEVVSTYMFVVAAILFVCFVAGLRGRLRAAEGGDATTTSIAYGSAIVFAGLLTGGTMLLAGVPAGMALGGVRAPEGGDIVNFMQSAGYGMMLVGAMLFAATSIAAISLVSMRTGALPRWSAWLGYVCAFVLLFAVVWLPQIALLVWVVAVSVVLLREPSRATAPVAAPAT